MEVTGEKYKGYQGEAKDKLVELGIQVWSDVDIITSRGTFTGIILPRSESADNKHVVLKLRNGYNIGIGAETITGVKELGYQKAHYQIPEKEFPVSHSKPDITLIGTGGTIASRLDYRTGAVIPAFSPGELFGSVPELADVCNLKTMKIYGVFSENIGPKEWIGTAKHVSEEIANGADGIVIAHGTDTMHYTSAAISFMVQNTPVPIIIVGSQRSSDRPSSDAALNLINSCKAAGEGNIAEVSVCMFGPTSDYYCLIHSGTRVRKMHSSYRSTFRTIGDIPFGSVSPKKIKYFRNDYIRRKKDRKHTLQTNFEEKVTLLYYYPNMQPDIIDALVDNGYKGIVIAGTGLGHVNKPVYSALKKATENGVTIFMTVQTIWGFAQMFVYETGRDIMDLGVEPLDNMLPEVAYVKLGWVLGQTQKREEIIKMMQTPVAREITEREPIDGYLVYQGGISEIERFMKQNLK